MKLKNLLKFTLPILGVSALAISLPLALTSCGSDEKSLEKNEFGQQTVLTNKENVTNTINLIQTFNFSELNSSDYTKYNPSVTETNNDNKQANDQNIKWGYQLKPSSNLYKQIASNLNLKNDQILQITITVQNNSTQKDSTPTYSYNLCVQLNYDYNWNKTELGQSIDGKNVRYQNARTNLGKPFTQEEINKMHQNVMVVYGLNSNYQFGTENN